MYRRWQPRTWGQGLFASLTPLPPSGQSLALALLLSPLSTVIPGLASGGPGACLDMLPGWTPEDLEACLDELERNGAIVDLKTARAVFIPWFLSVNACPESPNVVKTWRKRWIELPESHLKSEVDSHVAAFLAEFRPAKDDSANDASTWVEAWHGSNAKGSRKPGVDLRPTFSEGSARPSIDRAGASLQLYPEPGIRTQGSELRGRQSGIGEGNSGNGVRKGEQEAGIRGGNHRGEPR